MCHVCSRCVFFEYVADAMCPTYPPLPPRIVLSTRSRSGLEANVLEAFFPFDPYNLRDSAVHITNYVEWTPSEDGVPDIMDDGIDR